MQRFRRFLTSIGVGTLLAGLALSGTASAGPPSTSGIVVRFDDVWLVGYVDPTDGLVALSGPPAELGCLGLGFDAYFTTIQATALPPGVIAVHVRQDDVPMHVYRATSIADVCEPILGGGSPNLVATGSVRFTENDNDLFVSGTRMNSFGGASTGVLTGTDGGSWTFTGVFRGLVEGTENGECICRVVREDILLSPRGR